MSHKASLAAALTERGLSEKRVKAAVVLLGDSVTYDASGEPVNLEEAIAAAKEKYSSGPFDCDSVNLSAEEREAAKICHMTPEEYVNYSSRAPRIPDKAA